MIKTRRIATHFAYSLRLTMAVLTSLAAIGCSKVKAQSPTTLSPAEVGAIATDAYIFGYPLVTMDLTRQVMTNVEHPGEKNYAPMGQFANMRTYPDPSYHDVTAPNANTLYSVAWLDLSGEPYVLSLPDEHGRYYLMPMLSGWTDVFRVPGTRTTGTGAQRYVIVGPKDSRTPNVPGATVIRSPTALVWIVGRTFAQETEQDIATVNALQRQYRLVPLSADGKAYTPPPGRVIHPST
jgi:hypothetical protein